MTSISLPLFYLAAYLSHMSCLCMHVEHQELSWDGSLVGQEQSRAGAAQAGLLTGALLHLDPSSSQGRC